MSGEFCVMVDPGHGGQDPGAPAGDPVEALVNLRVASFLEQDLALAGVRCFMTRYRDSQTMDLAMRVAMERALRPALTVSLHSNAAADPGAHGIEIFTSPGHTPSDAAATSILQAVGRMFPERRLRRDYSDGDPDKEARFAILTQTAGAAVLLEMGFLSHAEERAWLERVTTQRDMARAVAAGVLAWKNDVDERRT